MDITLTNRYMRLALQQAKIAKKLGDLPIGAIIIDIHSKKILAQAHNQQFTSFDPTAHAEISAIREACHKLKSTYLPKVALFTSTEPCTMCISAILKAKIPELYFGVSNRTLIESGFNLSSFDNSEIIKINTHKINVHSGILAEECLKQRIRLK